MKLNEEQLKLVQLIINIVVYFQSDIDSKSEILLENLQNAVFALDGEEAFPEARAAIIKLIDHIDPELMYQIEGAEVQDYQALLTFQSELLNCNATLLNCNARILPTKQKIQSP